MAPAPPPVVGLWAHRWADLAERTGVGRYALELTAALVELAAGGDVRYERRGGREAGDDGLAPVLRRSWPPRQALHAAWLAVGRPRLEQVAAPVDLLHVLFPSFPVPTRAPLVGTINDLIALERPGWYGSGERRAVVASTRRIAAQADRVITISRHVADQVVERLGVEPERVVPIPLGVGRALTPDGPTWTSPTGRPHVVAVGAEVERKNLPLLVRALAEVPGLDLVLVGPPGAATTALDAAIAAAGLADRVHRRGRLTDAELAATLRGALALAHPSLDEGFGLPPLEAMALGTPAVVARSGALPEVVGEAAVLLDPHDAGDWAAALSHLLADADHRAERAAAGRARAATFTWARTAAATADVHRAVLRERGRL